jgi:hypothetical protein
MVSKAIETIMVSKAIVATVWSDNDLGSQCCNRGGGHVGVTGTGGRGTEEDARGVMYSEQQALEISPRCAVPGGDIAP